MAKRRHNVVLYLNEEACSYIVKCARIRDVSVGFLLSRIVHIIAEEQMCAAVLDDDGRKMSRAYGQHKSSKLRNGEYPL